MQAIQQGESLIVVVMSTGRGKSILFIVPVFTALRGTTIIIVLLVVLQANMIR